jgi:uncharacterized membrane protein YgdD (TMEM256/DUF423 family)
LNLSPVAKLRIAAGTGALAVLIGAFGAHGLRSTLALLGTAEIWNTASLYHLLHAVVLLFVARQKGSGASFWLFAIGILLFSGSLYLYAVTAMKPLTFLAPAGGLCLIAGWLSLALGARDA